MSNESPPVAADAVSIPPAPVTVRGGRLLATVALLGVALGGVGAGYWLKRVYEPAQATIAAALASNDRSTTGFGGELRSLHERLRALEDAGQATTSTLQGLTDELAALRTELAAPATATQTLLRHARIEHLIRTAALVLAQQQDVPRAAAALAAAAAELIAGNAEEETLNSALARDRAALAALQRADVAALAAHWAEIARGIDRWPWPHEAAGSAPPDGAEHAVAAEGWQGLAASVWRDIRQLVEIRTIDDDEPRLADPAREALIKAGLKLEISLLRAALLARDEAAVRTSVTTLETAIRAAFASAEPPVAAALAALGELSSQPLAPSLPTLEESLRALEGLQADPAPAADPLPSPSAPTVTAPLGTAPREFM